MQYNKLQKVGVAKFAAKTFGKKTSPHLISDSDITAEKGPDLHNLTSMLVIYKFTIM